MYLDTECILRSEDIKKPLLFNVSYKCL